jgi:hypothetical protein
MHDVIAVTPIDALPLVQALRDSAWLDAVRAMHLLGVSLLVGGVLAFDLRVLGLGRQVALRGLSAYLLPLAVLGFALAAVSGLMLFVTRASELLISGLFLTKLSIIFLMGGNAVFFHLVPWRDVDRWPDGGASSLARVCVAMSALGWIAVLTCGAVLGG